MNTHRLRPRSTFISAYPYRMVQVNLGLFHNAAQVRKKKPIGKALAESPDRLPRPLWERTHAAPQVLLDFDLDYCSVGFDGRSLRALPRALAALTARCAVLRPDLKALHMRRALKYAERGFGLALPRRALVGAGGAVVPASVYGTMAYAKLGLLMREGVLTVESA